MVYQPKNPIGYKQLLTWKQAGDIIIKVKSFVDLHLKDYDDKRLTTHLIDSARSVQRNIEEGYKRATTKEYVQFLGFSRGSLEELKGDFEELKREVKVGARIDKSGIAKKIDELLTLIYGEDCMMGRQIESLEEKMVKEKTLPRSEVVKKTWARTKSADDRFWKKTAEKFGIIRDKEGFIKRVNKGEDNKGGDNSRVEEGSGGDSRVEENKSGNNNRFEENKGGDSKKDVGDDKGMAK